jgi:OOP family OmpA-OmpF porin
MKAFKLSALACLAAGALSTNAMAGGYFGIGLGKSTIDDNVKIPAGTSVAVDESSLAWKIFGGYGFTDNIGMELGWVDLGDMNEGGNADMETDGFMGAAVGTLPIGDTDFSVSGKVGFYMWDQDVNTASHSGVDAMYGLGAKYTYDDAYGIGLSWERYNARTDVDLISVDLTLNF